MKAYYWGKSYKIQIFVVVISCYQIFITVESKLHEGMGHFYLSTLCQHLLWNRFLMERYWINC